MSGAFQNTWVFYAMAAALLFVIAEDILRRKFRVSSLVRAGWIVLLSLIAADWTRITSQEWSEPQMLHVFFDRSDSAMTIPERKEQVARILREADQWSQKTRQPIRFYSFGDSVQSAASVLRGDESSLSTLLQPAADFVSDSEGAAIVLSDGLWSDYARLKMPTQTVRLGSPKEKDIWIENLQPVFTAFLKNSIKIPVAIGQKGFEGDNVSVSLWQGADKLTETEVSLSGRNTVVELKMFPEKMGESIFFVKVSEKSGELSTRNNVMPFRIRTVRDKIRILHVGGKPSYDLKIWRQFLTRQPDVDLVSFYILRALEDVPEAKNSELSLIPFPHEELFSTELEKFDVVILQNFDSGLYFQPFYLSNLAEFVRGGGALLMIGGDQSFHRYRSTPLEPLFPFRFLGSGRFEVKDDVVSEIAKHPITESLEPVLRVPRWGARHLIDHHPEALDLARYKSGIPFIGVRTVQKGRVVAINTDESWKLQMQPSIMPSFGRLARRLLQYMTFDPEMDPGQLRGGRWHAGKPVNLSLISGGKADWKISAVYPADLKNTVELKDRQSVTYEVPAAGVYEVKVSSLSEPLYFETEEQPWRGEWRNLISDASKLQQLARQSGGEFFEADQIDDLWRQPLSGRQVISAEAHSWTKDAPRWAWIVLLLAIGLMVLDFLLRKRDHWDA